MGVRMKNFFKILDQLITIIICHVTTIVTILFCFFACVLVPQLRNIFDMPWFWDLPGYQPVDILFVALFWLYIMLLAVIYISLCILVQPDKKSSDQEDEEYNTIIKMIENAFPRIYNFFISRDKGLSNLYEKAKGFWFIITTIAIASIITFICLYKHDPAIYASWLLLSFLILCLSIVLLLAKYNYFSQDFSETASRFLFFSIIMGLIGEVIWYSPIFASSVSSYRNYYIWAIIHACAVLVMFAQLFETIGPKTKLFLLMLPVIFYFSSPWIWKSPILGKQSSVQHESWLTHFNNRLDAVIDSQNPDKTVQNKEIKRPFIFVAAAGGGSRAALFASLVFEWLEKEKKDGDIVLISSVSGGSVATGYFISPPKNRDAGIHSSITSELQARVKEKIREDWIWNSTFVDDMNINFLAPLLRGAFFLPGIERGESMCYFWDDKFEWKGKNNLDLYDPVNQPCVIFNATTVNQGIRFAIGFPPLTGCQTDIKEKDLVVMQTLEEWSPNYQINLSEAVRVSANFPWGFEIPKLFVSDTKGEIKQKFLVDGGVSDNTGVDTIVEILKRIVSIKNNEQHPDSKTAESILNKLSDRGFIIVEIDSGAKPTIGKFDDSELTKPSPIFGPNQAISKASFQNSYNKQKIAYNNELNKMLHEEKITWCPIKISNPGKVMTSWALGPQDKADVIANFFTEKETAIKELAEAQLWIASGIENIKENISIEKQIEENVERSDEELQKLKYLLESSSEKWNTRQKEQQKYTEQIFKK